MRRCRTGSRARVTKENARQILTDHIKTVAGRYAGKLHSWDVVNEAIDTKSDRPDGLRKSPWFDLIGPDYIDMAFRSARQADSTALLTYNDYGIETDTPDQTKKRGLVLELVRGMKKRSVPIDAVGVQSHLGATDPAPGSGLRDFVRELRGMGLQVFITELDVNEKLRKLEGSESERDAAIARIYKDYVTMMVAEPNVTAVLTWGITDRYTWLDGAEIFAPRRQTAAMPALRCGLPACTGVFRAALSAGQQTVELASMTVRGSLGSDALYLM